MAMGTVKWFSATKGYGFIKPDGNGSDVFVQISAVEKAGYSSLVEGAKISYEVVAGRAENVSRKASSRLAAFFLFVLRPLGPLLAALRE